MRKKIWKFWAEFVENKGEYENNTWKKNIKRYTRKEKGKWKTLIVKEKKTRVSKCTKDILQLQVLFVSILPCLNLTIISSGLI